MDIDLSARKRAEFISYSEKWVNIFTFMQEITNLASGE